MSIALHEQVRKLEERVKALEDALTGDPPAQAVSGHQPFEKTGSTLTLPEKRKSA